MPPDCEYLKINEQNSRRFGYMRDEILHGLTPDALREFKCENCPAHLIAGAFVSRGSVTSPEKAYHLDFAFYTEAERDVFAEILAAHFKNPLTGERKGMYTDYYKNSDDIEDFLALTGATNAVFALINAKINKEIIAGTNRQINCDARTSENNSRVGRIVAARNWSRRGY